MTQDPQSTSRSERMREILSRVRQIEIRSRRAVHDLLAGEYHSVFKGRGMEFDEVREYQPGDEIRDIDWNVTARTGRAFIKRFVEEREQTVFFVVDVSGSGAFGTASRMKGEIAAEICALLSFSAIQNKDRVGLLSFSDRIEEMIPPRKGRKHVLRVVRQLLFARPAGRGTDIPLALDTLDTMLKRRSIVFLVSDFLGGADLRRSILMANRRHDLITIRVADPREECLPRAGIVELEDAETGETLAVDTASQPVRAAFEAANRLRRERLAKFFSGLGVDHIEVRTDAAYLDPLVKFFKLRARRP